MYVGQLVYQLEETLDTLALNLQKKLTMIPRNYLAMDKPDKIKGLENVLEEINDHFGTNYESDYDKLVIYFNNPVQKSKN